MRTTLLTACLIAVSMTGGCGDGSTPGASDAAGRETQPDGAIERDGGSTDTGSRPRTSTDLRPTAFPHSA